MGRGPSITPEQQDRIVLLRLDGVTQAETARQVGVNETTVKRYWGKYLESVAEERRATKAHVRLERELSHLARARRARQRQELQVVTRDHEGTEVLAVMDPRGLAALMAEEARAEAQIDKLLGLEKLTIEATVDVSQHVGKLAELMNRAMVIAELEPEQVSRLRAGLRQAIEEDAS